MKLFRHHTEEFQRKIEAANGFITDKSRKFNLTNKNEAGLYFYTTDVKGAEKYEVLYGETDICISKLYTYEVSDDIKLLDFTKEDDRRKVKKIVEAIVDYDNECRANAIKVFERLVKEAKKAKIRKYYQSQIDKLSAKQTTYEDVITKKDIVCGSSHLNDQRIVDFKNGLILRDELKELGYDGCIFSQFDDCREVVLFEPAKQI
ncbi:hypothetical protein EDM00_07825 [Ornithobacterium rhinotracheale]|uniref:hypothetical protein n=1 Tax=Ornithobacterium rhinotracheale TaxID=28251 RepID=UPI00129C71D3|nr:hypothetical protein [Ornithobacterium rhinotracheale]MRI63895.1 hypothetical protein [Ornithobacterium rhinotracheale]